jgi:two-component system LytT family response regulator
MLKAILVDDEPDGIRALKKMLECHCPDVNVAATSSSAEIAKQQIREIQPDVVFLDIQMPGKSGLELLTELPDKHFEGNICNCAQRIYVAGASIQCGRLFTETSG